MSRSEVTEQFNNPYLKAVGQVVTRFAKLEFTLGFVIDVLLDTDQGAGQIVTTKLPFRVKVDVFQALAWHRKPETKEDELLKDIIRNLGKLEDERNAVMHSVTAGVTLPDKRVSIKPTLNRKRGFDVSFTERTDADLKELAERMEQTDSDLIHYMQHFRGIVKGIVLITDNEESG